MVDQLAVLELNNDPTGQLIRAGDEVKVDVHSLARVQNVGGNDLTDFASYDQRVGKVAIVEHCKVDLPCGDGSSRGLYIVISAAG